MKKAALSGIVALLALEAGCMMGPKYKRPAVNVPEEYRTPSPQQAVAASSLGNEQWWQGYPDPVLPQLIPTPHPQNFACPIAAPPVPQAQAPTGITRPTHTPPGSGG